jgi:hypothetical protein
MKKKTNNNYFFEDHWSNQSIIVTKKIIARAKYFLKDNLLQLNKINCVDLGCGECVYYYVLNNYYNLDSYKGVDASKTLIINLKKKIKKKQKFFYKDIKSFKNYGNSNLILVYGVFNYMTKKDIINTLKNIKKYSKKKALVGGAIFHISLFHKTLIFFRPIISKFINLLIYFFDNDYLKNKCPNFFNFVQNLNVNIPPVLYHYSEEEIKKIFIEEKFKLKKIQKIGNEINFWIKV